MPQVEIVKTPGFQDQKPGTSGLRKRTRIFMQEGYVESFAQSIFDAVPELKGSTLLLSGDGRFYSKEAIQKIAQVAAGNGVKCLWIGQNGLISTPAASAVIRRRANGCCRGAILLTASHNVGGIDGDFGIKFNVADGSPAPESLTGAIYAKACALKEYKSAQLPSLDLTKKGTQTFSDLGFTVEVIDPVEDWVALMKEVFDFAKLQEFFDRFPNFSFAYDSMHAVGGIYAEALFRRELSIPKCTLLHQEPLEDFGGLHPDPNLEYATELVQLMGFSRSQKDIDLDPSIPDFGAAGDGDNDRNMILGRNFFVTPSDSVAIIAAYATTCIPWFKQKGVSGFARSMPTSRALNSVASALGTECYEVPTGWKFFNSLMNSGLVDICGEESFGTGSSHIREKDGLWAVLAWLSIIASHSLRQGNTTFTTVQQIVEEFWKTFGRYYYTRHDFEGVPDSSAQLVLERLSSLTKDNADTFTLESKLLLGCSPEVEMTLSKTYKIQSGEPYSYTDPVDKSCSKDQGYRFLFKPDARVVFRQSGTGSQGTTLRIYIEKFEARNVKLDPQETLKDLIAVAAHIGGIERFVGGYKPTVIV